MLGAFYGDALTTQPVLFLGVWAYGQAQLQKISQTLSARSGCGEYNLGLQEHATSSSG